MRKITAGLFISLDGVVEDSCDEFRGLRGSQFMNPVASDPTMDSARAGALKSDWRR